MFGGYGRHHKVDYIHKAPNGPSSFPLPALPLPLFCLFIATPSSSPPAHYRLCLDKDVFIDALDRFPTILGTCLKDDYYFLLARKKVSLEQPPKAT